MLDVEEMLTRVADGFVYTPRSPVLHRPSEEGLEYEKRHLPLA
jgi:hypothetical protein